MGVEVREPYVKRVRIRSRIVIADVCIGQMLITIPQHNRIVRACEKLYSTAEIDGVHELRSLRGKHATVVVDKTAVAREKRLHATSPAEVQLQAYGAYARAVMRDGCSRIR